MGVIRNGASRRLWVRNDGIGNGCYRASRTTWNDIGRSDWVGYDRQGIELDGIVANDRSYISVGGEHIPRIVDSIMVVRPMRVMKLVKKRFVVHSR